MCGCMSNIEEAMCATLVFCRDSLSDDTLLSSLVPHDSWVIEWYIWSGVIVLEHSCLALSHTLVKGLCQADWSCLKHYPKKIFTKKIIPSSFQDFK
ncbi:uncharacterized protein LOC144665414 isoform X2 [Oculina patagonica]